MYLCVCKAVTESDVHRAIDEGAVSLKHLQEKLDVTTSCGSCHMSIKSTLERRISCNYTQDENAQVFA